MRGVNIILKDEGVLIVEVHYVRRLIEGLQYDFAYHEHAFYLSLISMGHLFGRFEMQMFDAKVVDLHGGLIRVFAGKSVCQRTESKSLRELMQGEYDMHYHQQSPFQNFGSQVQDLVSTLSRLIRELKSKGSRIGGYGACARATCIMAAARLSSEFLDVLCDDSPVKIGAYSPYCHLKIQNPYDVLYGETPPDYLILFAWPYKHEITEKHPDFIQNGGKIIIPLPSVSIHSLGGSVTIS